MEWIRLWIMSGLKTFSSKLPCAPAMVTAVSLPMVCTHTIVMASDWVGLTLPGMMDEPGSLAGRVNSPRPERGPEPSQRMSLAIFIRAQARALSAPLAMTIGSSEASAANLLGAEVNGKPVYWAMRWAER